MAIPFSLNSPSQMGPYSLPDPSQQDPRAQLAALMAQMQPHQEGQVPPEMLGYVQSGNGYAIPDQDAHVRAQLDHLRSVLAQRNGAGPGSWVDPQSGKIVGPFGGGVQVPGNAPMPQPGPARQAPAMDPWEAAHTQPVVTGQQSIDSHLASRFQPSMNGLNPAAADYYLGQADRNRAAQQGLTAKSDAAQAAGTYGTGGYGYQDNMIVDPRALQQTRGMAPEEQLRIQAALANIGGNVVQGPQPTNRPLPDQTVSIGADRTGGPIDFRSGAGAKYVDANRAILDAMRAGVDPTLMPRNTLRGNGPVPPSPAATAEQARLHAINDRMAPQRAADQKRRMDNAAITKAHGAGMNPLQYRMFQMMGNGNGGAMDAMALMDSHYADLQQKDRQWRDSKPLRDSEVEKNSADAAFLRSQSAAIAYQRPIDELTKKIDDTNTPPLEKAMAMSERARLQYEQQRAMAGQSQQQGMPMQPNPMPNGQPGPPMAGLGYPQGPSNNSLFAVASKHRGNPEAFAQEAAATPGVTGDQIDEFGRQFYGPEWGAPPRYLTGVDNAIGMPGGTAATGAKAVLAPPLALFDAIRRLREAFGNNQPSANPYGLRK